jgi:hypothetical protein
MAAVASATSAGSRRAPLGRTAEPAERFSCASSEDAPMRKPLTALLATAALGAAPVADARAQTAQDTLGRVLEGLQGGQDQRPAQRGYRDDDRLRDDRS